VRIKIGIANYGSSQLEYLDKVVEEFRKNKRHHVDITVYTTVPVEYPHVIYPPSIGTGLTYVCRRDMILALPDYDLFIYDENDHLITEDNIEAFLEHSRTLPEGMVSGFLQYEINTSGNKILVALNPYFGEKLTENKTAETFQPQNRHQACWILLRKDLDRAVKSSGFVEHPHVGPYGELEQGASDPYTQCGLTKVLPTNYGLCERLMIHHLPNKYTRFHEWVNHGIDLKTLFNNYLGIRV